MVLLEGEAGLRDTLGGFEKKKKQLDAPDSTVRADFRVMDPLSGEPSLDGKNYPVMEVQNAQLVDVSAQSTMLNITNTID